MLQAGSRGEVEHTLAMPQDEDLPRFLSEAKPSGRRSLGEALSGVTGRGPGAPPRLAQSHAAEVVATPADFHAGRTPDLAIAAPPLKGEASEKARTRPPQKDRSATGLDAWMRRAKRERRSAALRQFGAWSVTILVAATIIGVAAIALTAFAAP